MAKAMSARMESLMNICSGFWYTREICRERFSVFFRWMLSPFRRMSPEAGFKSPTISFSKVDLPAPLEPISATLSPLWMVRSSPSNTTRSAPFTER